MDPGVCSVGKWGIVGKRDCRGFHRRLRCRARQGTASRYGIGNGTLAVVYKFDTDGNLLWTHQTTTSKALLAESATGIALNGGAVYVAGLTKSVSATSAYVRKLDPSAGTEVWTSTFVNSNGINGIHPYGVAADATGAYVVGSTPGPLSGQPAGPGQDLFIRKYDPSGNALWTNQFGTPERPGICVRGERELKWRLRGRHHAWVAGNSNAADFCL